MGNKLGSRLRSDALAEPKTTTDKRDSEKPMEITCTHSTPNTILQVPKLHCLHTLTNCARHLALEDSTAPAFIFHAPNSTTVLTRGDLLSQASRYGALLQSLGVPVGRVVANCLVNSPERAITDLGAMLAKVVTLHVQPFLKTGYDVIYNLQKCHPRVVVLDSSHRYGVWLKEVLNIGTIKDDGKASSPFLPTLQYVVECRDGQLLKTLKTVKRNVACTPEDPRCPVYIFPASCDKGFVRLVTHCHSSLLVNASYVIGASASGPNHCYYNDTSFGWYLGFPLRFYALGATRVCLDRRVAKPFDHLAFMWSTVIKEKCEVVALHGHQMDALLSRPDLWLGASHRPKRVVTWGAPLPRSYLRLIGVDMSHHHMHWGVPSQGMMKTDTEVLADELRTLYYVTEVGVVASVTHRGPEFWDEQFAGFLLPGVMVVTVDCDGELMGESMLGELCVSSPSFMWGYWGEQQPAQRSSNSSNTAGRRGGQQRQFFRTHDTGFYDARQRLYVIQPSHGALIRGNQAVLPHSMEQALKRVPGIKDIMLVSSPGAGESIEICACVLLGKAGLGADDVKKAIRDLFLDGEDEDLVVHPYYIIFLHQFPVDMDGKEDRVELRKMVLDRYRRRLLRVSRVRRVSSVSAVSSGEDLQMELDELDEPE